MRTLYPCSLHFLRYLPVLLGLVMSSSILAQTFPGDVTISTQADLDAFVAPGGGTYDRVEGSFIIRPVDNPTAAQVLTDFSNVADLVTIADELRIDNYESEQTVGDPLSQFINIDSIGSLRVFDNVTFNSGLTGLSNDSLRIVDGILEIGNNDKLVTLVTFPSLTNVSFSFIIRNNPILPGVSPPALTTIGGNFRIVDNDALTNLDNFDQVSVFSGGFFIRDNGTLSNIDGFANSSNVRFDIPALVVENNPELETLGGTPGPNVIRLRVTDSIIISNNVALTEISTEVQGGISGGDMTLSAVRIINNDNLTSAGRIFDRDYMLTIGDYIVTDNQDLNNLGGQNINITGNLNISANPNLTRPGNFAATTNLSGDLTIFDNAILNTFVRLGGDRPENGLRTVAGDIRVENNPQLTTLEGFRRLTQGQSLILNSIGLVSDLSGIRSLDTLANFLTITNNPNLSDCCEIACELIVNGQQVDGTNNAVLISGNTGGCEDKPTFVSNCQDEPGKGCLNAAPVEWLAFTGALGSGSIDLAFSTATESDNDYFQIERSVAGGAFVAIGQIDGAGNSQTALEYSFSDYDYSSGLNYYRIRQVDFDGTEAFSDVIVVDAGGSKLALTLFPNPANGSDVTLQLGRDWNADRVTAQIYSVAGQFVREIRATGNSRLFLPTADLQAGMYAVRVSDGSRTVTTRLTVR